MTLEQNSTKNRNLNRFFLSKRKIFLWEEIDGQVSLKIIKQLKYLFARNKTPIYLYINSVGGEVEPSLAIIDEIRGIIDCGGEIYTIAQGSACSMAAYILACGSYRYATENTTIMLHSVWGNEEGDNVKIKRSVDFYSKKEELILKFVAERCKKNTQTKFKNFKEDIEKNLWMTPSEAKKYGIIDDIYNYEWEDEAETKKES